MLNARLLKKSDVPTLQFMLADLGNPPAKVVAKALGVSLRTVRGWLAKGCAPHAASIAIFWHTSYGRATIDADLVNAARNFAQVAAAQSFEMNNLRTRIAYLESIGTFGAANDPLLGDYTRHLKTGTFDSYAQPQIRTSQFSLF